MSEYPKKLTHRGCHLQGPHHPAITLANSFHFCSYAQMIRFDIDEMASAILAAPGWARVGITAPARHIRDDAARELARTIADALVQSQIQRIRDARPEPDR